MALRMGRWVPWSAEPAICATKGRSRRLGTISCGRGCGRSQQTVYSRQVFYGIAAYDSQTGQGLPKEALAQIFSTLSLRLYQLALGLFGTSQKSNQQFTIPR